MWVPQAFLSSSIKPTQRSRKPAEADARKQMPSGGRSRKKMT
jgi:hypothetical protein